MPDGTKPKAPTAPGISALLRKAGFTRSQSSATAIKGWRDHSFGYVVHHHHEGGVSVYHETGHFRVTDETHRRQAGQEEKYAKAIEEAGYAVRRQEGGYFNPLIVTAKGA